MPDSWHAAQGVDVATLDDVVFVLANSVGMSSEKVLWLRKRIWWALNDRYRIPSSIVPATNIEEWSETDERANMEQLIELLKCGEMRPSDQVQLGELLRLLGRFDEAIAVLKAVEPDGYSEIRAVKIERLARIGDAHVRPLDE